MRLYLTKKEIKSKRFVVKNLDDHCINVAAKFGFVPKQQFPACPHIKVEKKAHNNKETYGSGFIEHLR